MGKGYEKRCKVTRVFLADYQLLKELSRQAGVSMAECLHKLITRQPEPTRQASVTRLVTQPAFRVSAQPAFTTTSQPIITTNGNKAGVFVIKPKGGKINA